jgi:hypothetical protein
MSCKGIDEAVDMGPERVACAVLISKLLRTPGEVTGPFCTK